MSGTQQSLVDCWSNCLFHRLPEDMTKWATEELVKTLQKQQLHLLPHISRHPLLPTCLSPSQRRGRENATTWQTRCVLLWQAVCLEGYCNTFPLINICIFCSFYIFDQLQDCAAIMAHYSFCIPHHYSMSLCFWNVLSAALLHNFDCTWFKVHLGNPAHPSLQFLLCVSSTGYPSTQHLSPDACVSIWKQVSPFSHHTHFHWFLCTCIKGISSFFVCLKPTMPPPPPPPTCHASFPVYLPSPPVLYVLWASDLGWCAGGWRGGAAIQMERRFLWWCTVGEREGAASWHERGGGDDELDVNKLSLPTQHSTHRNKQKQQRQTPDEPGALNNNQTGKRLFHPQRRGKNRRSGFDKLNENECIKRKMRPNMCFAVSCSFTRWRFETQQQSFSPHPD